MYRPAPGPLHSFLQAPSAKSLSTMRNVLVVCSLVGIAAAVPAASLANRPDGAPTVKVKNGTIAGVHSNTYNEDYFLGIPFAQAPVEQLRFRNPQSINTTFDETYQATEYKAECYGYGVGDTPASTRFTELMFCI